MQRDKFTILLADDDEDDCMFFKDALNELSLPVSLKIVANGADLRNFLENNPVDFPRILFLDLNMPRKTGIECLSEIKQSEKLKQLPVIIYSTSFNPDVVDLLYNKGAQHYIRKPVDFEHLKSVINKAIMLSSQANDAEPLKEKFVIQP
jgi:CheY-like chemotaxis protein